MQAFLDDRPLAALLLDLDDTILDDGAGYRESWDLAKGRVLAGHPEIEQTALAIEIDRAKDWFWGDPDRHRSGRQDLVGARAAILVRALEVFGPADAELAREASQAATELRDRHQRFLPGAHQALLRLREIVPTMALVTNGAQRPQRAKIVRFELAHFFDHIQVEGEFGLGKPEPAAYENVLGVLGVRAEDCMMVGDNFEVDVLGAQSAGIHAAWLDKQHTGTPPRPAMRPHWTIHTLRELVDRLLGDA